MFGDDYVMPSEQPPWFVSLWRRYRPATGWAVFLLTLAAVVLLPVSLVGGELIPGLRPAVALSIVAFTFAWFLSHRRISGPAAFAAIFLAGALADLLWGVFILRPIALASQIARWWSWAFADRTAPEPVITFFQEQGSVLGGYLQRVGWWIKGLIVGPGAPDNLALIGLIVLLAWLVAAWAAWWTARRQLPFIALLPTAVLLAQHAYWAPDTLGYVLLFLSVTAFLLALSQLIYNMQAWDAAGVDYADDIRLDVLMTALALTVIVTVVSPTVPFFASGEFSQRFWKLFESPWRRVEQQVSASFQVARPVRSLVPPTGAEPGGLPRAHLLGGAPELSEVIALRIRLRGDRTNLPLYWRGQTYQVYTGRGWEVGAGEPLVQEFAAGEPWGADLPSSVGRRPLVASVEVAGASRAVLYGLGEPVGVDRPYRALLRAPGELVALSAPANPRTYTVLSHVPELNPTTLRATGEIYPSQAISLYVQLPAELDPRLIDLAAEWTLGAATPYDKATAIEQQLRTIPYSLDIPTPPAGRELVSWFLFDLRTGYCDYYASAMVVLARLNRIPARIAIGYAAGAYDNNSGQYVVTEASAHTWPELYFPRIGWVPFEPTAYLPLPERRESAAPSLPPAGSEAGPADLTSGIAELQQSAQANAEVERQQTVARSVALAILALAALWAIWLRVASLRPVPAVAGESLEAYERLVGWGRRLGHPVDAGDTPREYMAELSEASQSLASGVRWGAVQAREAAAVVRNEGQKLTQEVERSLFAPPAASPQSVTGWQRLWRALAELAVVRRLPRRSVKR